DEDFDIDTRLEGVLVELNLKKLKIKALYGSLPDENRPVYNDLTYGIDLEKKLFDSFSFGLTAVSFRHIHSIGNLYNKFDVLGSRISLNSDVFDFYSEYAQLKETNNEIDPAKEGFAGYSNLNVYVGNFTFSGSYKKYEDFNYRLNDLPTVNYSSEPLAETIKIGTEEEGIMGEISFVPNFDNELIVNYAEAWNKDFTIRQNDAYAEFRHDFANSSLIAEHSHLERIDNNSNEWEQISKPALSFDFMLNEIPIYLKTEYEIHRKDHSNSESKYYEPLFQVDVEINNIGISLIAEYQYNSWDNLLKNPLWLGAEFSFDVLENTDLKLFAGKEKGGKVCRNGTCRYQSRFEGIRMELNTSF
ncbi:MAG: hypothetical protein H8E57_10940, partial [Candidatus Cloacimonetes bacterium]|nr:hypothetical protein [Candidatus Cloacimonadota bacterium]